MVSIGLPIGLIWSAEPLAEAQPVALSDSPIEIPTSTHSLPKPNLNHASTVVQQAVRLARPSVLAAPSSTSTTERRSSIAKSSASLAEPTTTTPAVAARRPAVRQQERAQVTEVEPTTSQRATTAKAPQTVAKTTTVTTEPPAPNLNRVVQVAKRYVDTGIPYVMGGNSVKTGMDCSHFVWMVLKEAGYDVPYRASGALASWTHRVSDPQPGDLVLYEGHVGIYVGNGMMIDQGKSGGAFLRSVFKDNFIGYGRMPL